MLALLLMTLISSAQEIEGFGEVRAQVQTGVDGFPATFVERFRPTFSAPLGKHFFFSTTAELIFVQGRRPQDELQRIIEQSPLGPAFEASGVAFPTEENEALGISVVADYLSVERLYFDAYTKVVDIRIGRQAINWGPAFLVNPTAPFPEVILTEPWKQRRGVNAGRFTFPIASLHQVQVVVGADDLFQNVRAAASATANIKGVDLTVVGAYRQEANNGLVGLSLRGTAGIGFWAEGSVHLGENEDPYEEIAVGIDYSFPVLESFVLTGQYYRNGNGSPKAGTAGASDVLVDTFLPGGEEASSAQDFAPYFSGRDYGMLSVALGIVPEVSTSVFWIQNFGDGTGFIVPTVSTFPTPWLEIGASAQVGFRLFGEGGEFSPREEDLVVSVPIADGVDPVDIDLSGLSASSTLTMWVRASF